MATESQLGVMAGGADAPRPRASVITAVIASFASFGALTFLGLWAYGAAFSVIPGLDLQRGAFWGVAPRPQAPLPRLARHVVFVIFDGLSDDRTAVMRELTELGERGVRTTSRAFFPSFTYPMTAALLTGVEPRYSGIRTNRWEQPSPVDTLPSRVVGAGLRAALVGTGNLSLTFLTTAWTDVRFLPQFGSAEFDRWSASTLAEGADLTLVYFSAIDDAGHGFGAASPEYQAASVSVDNSLGTVIRRVDLTQDTIVVTADHGHRARGGHGGTEDEVMTVPLVLAGAGIRAGAKVAEVRHTDVAPTIAALLGVPPPAHARGRTITEALNIDADAARAFAARDAERQQVLRPAIDSFEKRAKKDRFWRTLGRGTLALATFAGFFLVSRLLARRRWLIWDGRVLWLAAPIFTLSFYGIFLVFEGSFSISVMREFWPLVERLFRYGLAAAVLHALIAWFVLLGRKTPRERLAATSGLTIAGLVLAVTPAIVAYIVIGAPPHYALPPAGGVFFAMLAYAGLACYCAAASLVLALELAVFVARYGYRPQPR